MWLLAQCGPTGPCELPTGLPWYFGLAVAVVWLAAVVGAVLLARRFLLRRIGERRRRRRRAFGRDLAEISASSRPDVRGWPPDGPAELD